MKRLILALAIVAMAAACKKAEQQSEMAADTGQMMMDTTKAMMDTSHQMAGDTAKRM